MMSLTEEEENLLDSCCCLCLEEMVLTTGDYRWCEEHKFRGELLSWGMVHDYPPLDGGTYAVAHGAYFWHTAATQGSDDMVYILLGLIEMLEREGVA